MPSSIYTPAIGDIHFPPPGYGVLKFNSFSIFMRNDVRVRDELPWLFEGDDILTADEQYFDLVNLFQLPIDEPEVCSICLSPMTNGPIKNLVCGHEFHMHCLQQSVDNVGPSFSVPSKCPLCRQWTVILYPTWFDGSMLEALRLAFRREFALS
jgi:hypothetical protein